MDGLTEGRIVHYVMPNGDHRPAIVVKVWSPTNGCSNLQVFVDGTNDVVRREGEPVPVALWETSRIYSEKPEPFTWHWIEKA